MLRHQGEAWSGRGGPEGLAGTSIPLGARIIAVADAHEVCTRVHGLGMEEALEELGKEAGRSLDPGLVFNLGDLVRGRNALAEERAR